MATRKRKRKDREQLVFDLDTILQALEDAFIIKLEKFFKKLMNSFLAKAENLSMFKKSIKEITNKEIIDLKKLMKDYYKKVGKATVKQTNAELAELSGKSSKIKIVDIPEGLRLRAEELAKKKLQDYRDTLIEGTKGQEGTLKEKAALKKKIKSLSKLFINRHVTIVSRMESVTVANQRRLEAFQQSTIVAGVQFLAVLDKRTTEICRARHLKILKLSDPSLPNYTPPCHFGCRSLLSPVTVFETFNYSTNQELTQVPAKDFGKTKDVL